MATVDLNSDLGELWNGALQAEDEAMFPLVTSANIACGFHAGDAETMLASIRRAVDHGVAVGAHPSYRDRDGFGRRDIDVEPGLLRAELDEQIGALVAAAASLGSKVRYLKPHGALYNRIVADDAQADAVAAASAEFGLPVLGLGGAIERAAGRHGVEFIREAFADRAYTDAGELVPRAARGAVIDDPAAVARRAIDIVAHGGTASITGAPVPIDARSLCVHGDTTGSVAITRAVRAALADAGIELRPFV